MQTFLPQPDLQKSVECLDYRRLGKQRVECKQILKALASTGKAGWKNHPATKMWKGFEDALSLYYNLCIREWEKRGYNNTMLTVAGLNNPKMPPWFGDEDFHASHRSNLLRKDPQWYGQFGWSEPDDLEYVWPKGE